MTTVDHRRAVADRTRAAILDAAERLLADHRPLNMAALATAAGVSRPTLYAHFKTLSEVLEAAVARALEGSVAAFDAAELDSGPAEAALERMVDAGWGVLGSLEALARGAAEHLPTEHIHRAHAPLMARAAEVIERGQEEGSFRTDLPVPWLVATYFALIHSANDLARTRRIKRSDALDMLKTTLRDLVRSRKEA